MANTIGRFNFEILKSKKNSQILSDPIVILNLASWPISDGKPPAISPHLMTYSEIDDRIMALRARFESS